MNLDDVEADEVEADEVEADEVEADEVEADEGNWQFDEMAGEAQPADALCLGRCGYYAHTRPHWLRSSHGWDLNGWCCGSCHLVTCQLEGWKGPPSKKHGPYCQLRAIAEIEAGDDAQPAVDEMAGEAQPAQ